jgi:hypothetical protein
MYDEYVRRQPTNRDLCRALWRDLQTMFRDLFDNLRGWMWRNTEEPLKKEAQQHIECSEGEHLECGDDQPERHESRRAA